jgi:hypothetical protein
MTNDPPHVDTIVSARGRQGLVDHFGMPIHE